MIDRPQSGEFRENVALIAWRRSRVEPGEQWVLLLGTLPIISLGIAATGNLRTTLVVSAITLAPFAHFLILARCRAALRTLRNMNRRNELGEEITIFQSGVYNLRLAVALRQAMTLALPGTYMLFLGIALIPLLIPGLILCGTGILILFKAIFDRDLLSFNRCEVTVNALLSKRTIAWADVVEVSVRIHSWLDAKVLMTVGARRAIVVTGRNPQGGLTELLVPIDLLDLDNDGLTALVADLIACHAVGGEAVPAWQAAPQPREDRPTPAGDPRDSFDPDAIIAQAWRRIRAEGTQP